MGTPAAAARGPSEVRVHPPGEEQLMRTEGSRPGLLGLERLRGV